MHKGLTKKLDYEKGKLKAKGQQPDYRDRFVEEGDNFDRGGSHGNRITLADIARPRTALLKITRDDKLRALRFYEQKMRCTLLQVGEWRFRFGFSPAKFAEENGISIQNAVKVSKDAEAQATDRLRMTLRRAHKAQLEPVEWFDTQTGRTKVIRQLRFRTFVQTVVPIEWAKIYKRVLLCPTEEEVAEGD
jgi:hypothetical protein